MPSSESHQAFTWSDCSCFMSFIPDLSWCVAVSAGAQSLRILISSHAKNLSVFPAPVWWTTILNSCFGHQWPLMTSASIAHRSCLVIQSGKTFIKKSQKKLNKKDIFLKNWMHMCYYIFRKHKEFQCAVIRLQLNISLKDEA